MTSPSAKSDREEANAPYNEHDTRAPCCHELSGISKSARAWSAVTTDAVEPMSYPKRQPAMEANAKARRTLDLASRFQRTTGSEERGPGLVRGILSDASSVAPPLPARRTLAAMETKVGEVALDSTSTQPRLALRSACTKRLRSDAASFPRFLQLRDEPK